MTPNVMYRFNVQVTAYGRQTVTDRVWWVHFAVCLCRDGARCAGLSATAELLVFIGGGG